jgi:hypothetical protein
MRKNTLRAGPAYGRTSLDFFYGKIPVFAYGSGEGADE